MLISNMQSSRGNAVPNQFILFTPEATFFLSYKSVIVKTTFEDGKRVVILDEDYWDYSATTRKYRNQFLGETSADVKRKIKSGEYRLESLNNGSY